MSSISKAKRAANQSAIVKGVLVEGKTHAEIAKELGYSRRETVTENLAEMTTSIVESEAAEIVAELEELKEEVKRHRKGNEPLPLSAVDRLIKIAEVMVRIRIPEKRINASVDCLYPQELAEYREAFAGLYDDERYEEMARVKARKRTCRVVIDANAFQKQLPESGS